MQLKVLLPTEIFLHEPVRKVVAEAPNGSFCLLPAHIDFVTALVPGLLSYETEEEEKKSSLPSTGGFSSRRARW